MPKTSYLTSPFELVSVPVSRQQQAKPAPQPTNHIVVIDCSGSMYGDLPLIRTQLKDKLPRLIAEGDTLSLIWFSGRGEFGTLVKGEPVTTLKDLSDLNKAIDRWLKPVGLTGFKEPLEEVKRVASGLKGICSLFFMSDGYDNQWHQAQILKAIEDVVPVVASSTFVEYGYYCNHPLMVAMAEKAGGALILNEDFRKYQPSFEAAMQKRPLGAKRVDIEVNADVIKGFAFALDGDALLTFKVEKGTVSVPEHLDEVWFVTPAAKGSKATKVDFSKPSTANQSVLGAAYAAVALYSQRMATDVVLGLLKSIADVRLIKQFSGCFGKQKYAEFVEATTLASFDTNLRYQNGYDPSAVPDDNAFTVLDLLRIISEDDGNRLLLDSEAFKYNRIGRARVENTELTDEEQKQVDEIEREMKVAKGKLLDDLTTRLASLRTGKEPLKFEASPLPEGVPVDALVYNEERPNVSVQVRREGTVNMKSRKAGGHAKVPDVFPTFTFRNYTIIRDGLVNVETLPLTLTPETLKKLKAAAIPDSAITPAKDGSVVINLRELPIINRAMVKDTSAKELFELDYELTEARAAQKVYNTYLKDNFEKRTSEGFKVLFGEEEANWLKEQGITDYSGFGPKGKQAAKQDVYIGKELHVALKGLSTLPTLKDVQARIASGKHTATSSLMAPYVQEVEDFLKSKVYAKAADQPKVFKAWLEGQGSASKKKVRALLYQVSQVRMSVIVGQTWFQEFSSLDENTLTLDIKGQKVTGTVTMKEIEVPI